MHRTDSGHRALVGLLLAVAGCQAPAVSPAPGPAAAAPAVVVPICGDASGAVVVEGAASGNRVVRAYGRSGEPVWSASLGADPFSVPAGGCQTQVLSSSISGWSDPHRPDPVAVVRSPGGIAADWPGQDRFVKFRVLAATGLGTGVVATGAGGAVTVRLQVDGRFVHAEQMASSDVDWVVAPDGTTAVAYEYALGSGRLVFFELTGGAWRITDRVPLTVPAYAVYLDRRDRYLVRTEDAFVLHADGQARRLAGTDEASDAYLTGDYVVLLSRRSHEDGSLRTDVQVLDPMLEPVFTQTYPSLVIVSTGQSPQEILLSTAGAAVAVTPIGVRQINPGAGRYVLGGHDGVSVFAGPDSVEVKVR